MPRCGGCGEVCRCLIEGTDCLTVTGTGQTNNPYLLSPALSDDVGNSLECRDDGLFVGVEIAEGVNSGDGISGDGTGGSPIALAPPMAAGRMVNESIPHNTFTVLEFDASVPWDTDSMRTAGQRLAAPVAGVYHVVAGAVWGDAAWTGAELRQIAIRGNGTDLLIGGTAEALTRTPDGSLSAPLWLSCSRDYYLAAGGFVELLAFQQSAGSVSRLVEQAFLSLRYCGPIT